MTNPTAVLAVAASLIALGLLAAVTLMLLRSETSGTHELTGASGAYRPRPGDEADAVAPISSPPAREPVDALDPIWDWKKYLADQEASENELVVA